MSLVSRRRFLATAGAAAGAAAVGRRVAWAKEDAPKPAEVKITKGTDLVTLGNSGIKTSVLGIGTGTHGGREQRALGQDGFSKLVHHAYDRGLRYIDTADMYKAHGLVRESLKDLPRDEFFIQTKSRAKDAKTAKADVERFRTELGTDYLDTCLMHCMTTGTFPTDMRPVMDELHEAKEKGRVRAVGVSCHGFPPLAASAGCDWCDVHLVRINPFGDKMDGKPEEVSAEIKKMHAQGRGVIGMKIFGETGFDSRAKRLQSLQYVLGLGCVHAFTIGFTAPEQIDETLDLIEQAVAYHPLGERLVA